MKFTNPIERIKSAAIGAIIQSTSREWFFYKFWHRMGMFYSMGKFQRDWAFIKPTISEKDFISEFAPDMKVKYGPFSGLRYPEVCSVGSTLTPKLIGSYERELHTVFEKIIATGYSEIVDIGCAEGYYAVGLAKKINGSHVWAYDTDAEAIRLCQSMAELNSVQDRMKFGVFCNPQELLSIPLSDKALIICDCEGYEKVLFTTEVCEHLRPHDVLIEVHDFLDPQISSLLRNRFQATHELQVIHSLPDRLRAEFYHYPELEKYNHSTQMSLLAELRLTSMEWFFFRSCLHG